MRRRPFTFVIIAIAGASLTALACSQAVSAPATPVPQSTAAVTSPRDLEASLPDYITRGWKTDFSRHAVPYSEIVSGGQSRDGVPPLDDPKHVRVADAPSMDGNEPVISLEINGQSKAYPLSVLIFHEIVNDELGGVPVAVTYCPLCNTAIVFDRRVDGRVLDFGTTGNLRNSDLIMWDRQTESWWQQITGEAIVGELTGKRLKLIPAALVSWVAFRDAFPEGSVLSRDTGFDKDYDGPRYGGYDDDNTPPFEFTGEIDPRLKPKERVVALKVEGQAVAYPFALLERHPVINDSVEGRALVVFKAGCTLSPFLGLDPDAPAGVPGADVERGRVVGSTAVYEPDIDGRRLTFKEAEGAIVDEETGSTWNILGHAVDGPLRGRRLTPVLHGNHFWFAWAAFNPDTIIRTDDDVSR